MCVYNGEVVAAVRVHDRRRHLLLHAFKEKMSSPV